MSKADKLRTNGSDPISPGTFYSDISVADIQSDNFRRNDNKLAYLYLLTPEGAAAKLRLTRAYLARKEAEYLALKSEIETMRAELAAQEGQG